MSLPALPFCLARWKACSMARVRIPASWRLAGQRSIPTWRRSFQKVQSLGAAGRRADVDKLLIEIDEHYGGLAAPRSVDLASK